MTTDDPIATFGRDGKPALLKGLLVAPFFAAAGAFLAGDVIASTLGTSELQGQVVGAIALTVPFLLALHVLAGRGRLSVYDDSLVFRDATVRYDDVAFAVREDGRSGRLFGTATFELVVLGGRNLVLRYVTSPDELEGRLAERLTPPADQLADGTGSVPVTDAGDGDRHLTDRRQFWEYWRADERLPDVAMLAANDVESAMGVDAIDYDRLDGVDVRDVDGLADIDESDVTASDPHPAHH